MNQEITVHELKSIFSEDQLKNKILVDVRSPKEHQEMRIAGAVNIPLEQLASKAKELDRYDLVFLHCRTGGRSQKACEVLKGLSHAKTVNVRGGILEWDSEGFPVIRGKTIHMTLLRQVHLTVGLITVLGAVLGAWLSPAWLVIPAFTGAGLFFSGATGWCGMAELLSRMPWNK